MTYAQQFPAVNQQQAVAPTAIAIARRRWSVTIPRIFPFAPRRASYTFSDIVKMLLN
jgi:hypothetical protein